MPLKVPKIKDSYIPTLCSATTHSTCGMFRQGFNIMRTTRKIGLLHPLEILALTAVNQLLLGVQTALLN